MNDLDREKLAQSHAIEVLSYLVVLANRFIDQTDNCRDFEILSLYLQGYTREELAEKFNLSTERIRQLVLKAGKHLSLRSFKCSKDYKELEDRYHELENALETEKHEHKQLQKMLPENSEKEKLDTCSSSVFIRDLDIPARLANLLKRMQIKTVYQLSEHSAQDLLSQEGCGRKSVDDAARLLKAFGLQFKPFPVQYQIRQDDPMEVKEIKNESKIIKEKSDLNNVTDLPFNHGKKWSASDDDALRLMYLDNASLEELASKFGRTVWSILGRLNVLGFELPEREPGQPPVLPEIRKFK